MPERAAEPLFNPLVVLDAAEEALRMGNLNRLHKIIFVWSQRKVQLMLGLETWEDQQI